jgi:hypothetical protein
MTKSDKIEILALLILLAIDTDRCIGRAVILRALLQLHHCAWCRKRRLGYRWHGRSMYRECA